MTDRPEPPTPDSETVDLTPLQEDHTDRYFQIAKWIGAGLLAIVVIKLGVSLEIYRRSDGTGADVLGAVGLIILGMATGIPLFMRFFPTVLAWIGRPFLKTIDSLILPTSANTDRPKLDYKLADFYERERQWEKLAATYERISSHYPKETRPYVRLVMLYNMELKRPVSAKLTRLRAKKALEDFEYQDVVRSDRMVS